MTASLQPGTVGDRHDPAGHLIPAPSIVGYESIQRFFDPRLDAVSAKILPGEYYVTAADEVITTLLGSCVTACIWDPVAGLGGMNHFMIPDGRSSRADGPDVARYGMFAMEFLINSILSNGGKRGRLKAKITGGGHVIAGATTIGRKNVAFARDYLRAEAIELVSEHVEGTNARRVAFHPLTGRCRIQELTSRAETIAAERKYAAAIHTTEPKGDVELF